MFRLFSIYCHCTQLEIPPEMARVRFTTRTNLPVGLGGPEVVFSSSSSVGFATISIITETTPRTTKTARQISSRGFVYSSYFWGSCIKCRDYITLPNHLTHRCRCLPYLLQRVLARKTRARLPDHEHATDSGPDKATTSWKRNEEPLQPRCSGIDQRHRHTGCSLGT